VDVERLAIIQRVLAKEILRQAFQTLNLFGAQASDSVHGEFGSAAQWSQPTPPNQPGGPPGPSVEQMVSAWIQNNQPAIARTTDVLLVYTHANLMAQRQTMIDFMNNHLIGRIAAGCQRSDANSGLVKRAFSERRIASHVRLEHKFAQR